MIEIDGSHGEGGGQVLRTSLALSLITRQPFRIANIRAKRKSPGLLRQHLTAVEAAARVGAAFVEGAALGASALTFEPHALNGGTYEISIGTAGSTTLVLQTILVPLLFASSPSVVEIEGGTHNPASPPFDFLADSYLPLLRRMGADVSIELLRPGFYPRGGGRILVTITPSTLGRLELESRGALVASDIRAVVAGLPLSIAEREVATAREILDAPARTETLPNGPGNFVSIRVASEQLTNVFTGFGARGVPAEKVARDAAVAAQQFVASGAAVDEHLADQLLLPMAIGGGGAFTTTELSLHATTNIEVIQRFVDVQIEAQLAGGSWQAAGETASAATSSPANCQLPPANSITVRVR